MFEAFILRIKEHMKIFLIIFILLFCIIFCTTLLFSHFNTSKKDDMKKYIVASNMLAQKENAKALEAFQEIYNSSKGMIEAASFMQILDLLLEDKQYDTVISILPDITTLKQEEIITIILYTKALNVMSQLKIDKKISPNKEMELMKLFANSIKKTTISNEYLAHKQAIIVAFSQSKALKLDLNKLPQNDLTEALRMIHQNTK
ncbi:MAG: Ca2+-binding EF-hand superfamily protein [Candidatus Deianiraeaceae bacterium]|jgi:Ca2+-binding EF-hand superfamily protein